MSLWYDSILVGNGIQVLIVLFACLFCCDTFLQTSTGTLFVPTCETSFSALDSHSGMA